MTNHSQAALIKAPHQFESVSIIIPVINETFAMEETVEILLKTCDPSDIKEILVMTCERTTSESMQVCKKLQEKIGSRFVIHSQKRPFVGGAFQDAFDMASGSHTVMISSDLETDPYLVAEYIRLSKQDPAAIITASRWLKGGNFKGYNPIKLFFNYVFQKMLAFLYSSHLTDMTFGFSLFPTNLLTSIRWEEYKHPFFLETSVKPIRLGITVIEVPAKWIPRPEGKSQNTFFENFKYTRIAIKTRFANITDLLRPEYQPHEK